jgi:hypothetical protein
VIPVVAGTVWRHKETVAHVDSHERTALLDLDHLDRPPMILEGSGAVVWQLIDGERDVDALVAEVASYYDESEDTVGPGVRAFLEELEARRLVVTA